MSTTTLERAQENLQESSLRAESGITAVRAALTMLTQMEEELEELSFEDAQYEAIRKSALEAIRSSREEASNNINRTEDQLRGICQAAEGLLRHDHERTQ